MATSRTTSVWVRFAQYQVDLSTGDLWTSDGPPARLQQQPLQVLRVLLEANGRGVSREELRLALWPQETFVDFEHRVNSAVRKLRQALDDSRDSPKFVLTGCFFPRNRQRLSAPGFKKVEGELPIEESKSERGRSQGRGARKRRSAAQRA